MHKLAKILFLLLIVGCGSDSGSKIISSSGEVDPNTGNGNNGGNGGDELHPRSYRRTNFLL